MPPWTYPFTFTEEDSSQVNGIVTLETPLSFNDGVYRPGKLTLEDGSSLELCLYHNRATATFMYLREGMPDRNLLEIAGLSASESSGGSRLRLPGQLCLGADRIRVIGNALQGIFAAPVLRAVVETRKQEDIAVFPIAREGLKYQVAEALFENYGYYCDEVVLDAHHVFDSSVPVYNRKVELTLFKDKDLNRDQREQITVAFIADSIASGLVMKEVIERVKDRFEGLQRIEVISPLTTVRGLCRIARAGWKDGVAVRFHIFETLLNALPPDYYYSAHFPNPAFHIRPDLEEAYRAWWGVDDEGNAIADTACAGYGWSEVFFSPRKQIQMINQQLQSRHNLTLSQLIRRNL